MTYVQIILCSYLYIYKYVYNLIILIIYFIWTTPVNYFYNKFYENIVI